jgi:hypothetical protein
MSAFARLLTRIRDQIATSDKEEFVAGFREGKEGGIIPDPDAFLMRRIGWLAGRWSRAEEELEASRAESVDRICAAIKDVREVETKNSKLQEQRLIDIIKHWRERALGAEWMCHELGHTIVPGQINFTEGKPN